MIRLRHGKIDLALHRLQDGARRPLLLLHGLADRSPQAVPADVAGWSGPVHALDFTGHGLSTVPRGGGYTAEVLMGDADAALAHLGPCTVLGRGLGAYVALLLSGARPEAVRGAVLADGPGLAGGGPVPGSPRVVGPAEGSRRGPDPFALAELSGDVRPPDYATSFIRQATHLGNVEHPVTVAARVRPPWLEAVAAEPGVRMASTVSEALSAYAGG